MSILTSRPYNSKGLNFFPENKGPLKQLNYHAMFAIHMLELTVPKAYTIGCYYYLGTFCN